MKCAFCQRTATREYVSSSRSLYLCNPCLDRVQVQEAYEQRILNIEHLSRSGDVAQALSTLQSLYEEYAKRDHDGWLRRTIQAHRAHVLGQHGRFSESLAELRALARSDFPKPAEYIENQLAIADTLDRLDEPEQAIHELETALAAAKGAALPGALNVFVRYAQILHRQRASVPIRYRGLLNEVLNWWGIQIPADLMDDAWSLEAAINRANEVNREGDERYTSILEQLRDARDDRMKRIELLRAYVDIETVGYYRESALRMLQEEES